MTEDQKEGLIDAMIAGGIPYPNIPTFGPGGIYQDLCEPASKETNLSYLAMRQIEKAVEQQYKRRQNRLKNVNKS